MISGFIFHNKKLEKLDGENSLRNIQKKAQYWIILKNPTKEEVDSIKEQFSIHPITAEDIILHHTRIKYEEFDENTVIIFKGIKEIKNYYCETYNISLVIGENSIITSYEGENEIIERLEKNPARVESLLKKGKSNIGYYILDKEVDKYLATKLNLSEDLKSIEEEFMKSSDKEVLKKLLTRELLFLDIREYSESITDVCLSLTKPADNYIENDLIPYFRDIYDHALKGSDGFRAMLKRIIGIKNSYISINSFKMNENMRTLTLIMAIMMPLTIITGFYGMNVKLPFQSHTYASAIIFGTMIILTIIMILISTKNGFKMHISHSRDTKENKLNSE